MKKKCIINYAYAIINYRTYKLYDWLKLWLSFRKTPRNANSIGSFHHLIQLKIIFSNSIEKSVLFKYLKIFFEYEKWSCESKAFEYLRENEFTLLSAIKDQLISNKINEITRLNVTYFTWFFCWTNSIYTYCSFIV